MTRTIIDEINECIDILSEINIDYMSPYEDLDRVKNKLANIRDSLIID